MTEYNNIMTGNCVCINSKSKNIDFHLEFLKIGCGGRYVTCMHVVYRHMRGG